VIIPYPGAMLLRQPPRLANPSFYDSNPEKKQLSALLSGRVLRVLGYPQSPSAYPDGTLQAYQAPATSRRKETPGQATKVRVQRALAQRTTVAIGHQEGQAVMRRQGWVGKPYLRKRSYRRDGDKPLKREARETLPLLARNNSRR
jgi:hypothetical protein